MAGGDFSGHIVPKGGTSPVSAEDLNRFLEDEEGINIEDARALISDGWMWLAGKEE